jgi:hypothetical protein
MITNNTLCCHWCKVHLGNASQVKYLNGNLPVCDLCLFRMNTNILDNIKDLESEFSKTVDENFWELI